MPAFRRLPVFAALLSSFAMSPAAAAPTAYRLVDLDLRDPHGFVSFIGCRDVTDTQLLGYSLNGSLQTSIQTDHDSNGLLDKSYLLVFDGNPAAGTTGTVAFRLADCTAPMTGTSCVPNASAPVPLAWTNAGAGTCLAPLAGTVRPYSPAITSASAPCFSTSAATLTLDLGFGPVTLRNARIAATWAGNPATQLVNGLLMGFVTETDANTTILPASFPIIGGKPLSAMLRGGTGSCASGSDKDVKDGVPGWWFYLNFTAARVPWTDPTVGVGDAGLAFDGVETFPNPSRTSLSIRFRTAAQSDVRVAVLDPQGREVAELARGPQPAGAHVLRWDGRDARGVAAGPGVYFVRVESGEGMAARRITLLR
jgi:hypothetical protein